MLAILLILPKIVYALPTAKYTLLVVDTSGVPIKGADASISFMRPKTTGWGGETSFVAGKTNSEGYFTGEGDTQKYGVYGAIAGGYYDTSFKYTGFTGISGILGFKKWQPWNPTLKVILKKIKNPIAMYAYHTDWVDIPKNGEFIGYDLMKHDWVVPYGKGLKSDFMFRLDKDIRSKQDYDAYLTLKFSSPLDGIQSVLTGKDQGSLLKLNHTAPISGYVNKLKQHKYLKKNQSLPLVFKKNQNYYFRVRSDEGNNESLYGKIHGNIEFSRFGYSNGAIRFTYYLNPDMGDQNVEFDPQKNLFKNLKNTMHNVNEP